MSSYKFSYMSWCEVVSDNPREAVYFAICGDPGVSVGYCAKDLHTPRWDIYNFRRLRSDICLDSGLTTAYTEVDAKLRMEEIELSYLKQVFPTNKVSVLQDFIRPAYEVLPEPYKNDSCLTFDLIYSPFTQLWTLVAHHDLGGLFEFMETCDGFTWQQVEKFGLVNGRQD